MTAALEEVSGQQHAPAALYPRERPCSSHLEFRIDLIRSFIKVFVGLSGDGDVTDWFSFSAIMTAVE